MRTAVPCLHLAARVKTHLIAATLLLGSAVQAGAQSVVDSSESATLTSATASARPSLFTASDAYWSVGALLASVALTRVDARISRHLTDSTLHANNPSLNQLANNFARVQEGTLFFGNLALWGVGRLTHQRALADIAFNAVEAVAAGTVVSQAIRGPLGRSRPRVTNSDDPYDFHPFQGFTQKKYRAFPSIHTEAAFGVATVYTLETQRRHPGATWIVAPIAYGIAAGPALSRLYNGEHWSSDLLSGAFLGTFVGSKVMRYNHDVNSTNRLRRFFLGPNNLQVGLNRSGLSFDYSGTF
jgi:membrane-associated phospholipid phosphatase